MAVASGLLKAFDPERPTFTPESQLHFLHTAARACGWRLGELHEPDGIIRTYTWISARWRNEVFSIVLENEGRAAAFVNGFPPARDGPYGDYIYADRPEFALATAELGSPLLFLTAEELRQQIFQEDRDFLGRVRSSMIDELRYWKPEVVGMVIFNFWD